MTPETRRYCAKQSNTEGFHKVMPIQYIFARHDFVMFTVWIASYLAMTPETRRYCAKQSNSG
jgi:hypothetical protein